MAYGEDAKQAAAPSPAPAEDGAKPKKKKYSRRYRDAQKLEEGFTRTGERLAKAVADGLFEYRRRRNRSARKKRDGAIKDAVRNWGRGLQEALVTAAKAPRDLTKPLSSKRLRKMMWIPLPFGRR
jgi:hypothetical protein